MKWTCCGSDAGKTAEEPRGEAVESGEEFPMKHETRSSGVVATSEVP